jgi:peptidoglycan/LPS O-acetylase OafA/YrhL
MSLSAGGVVAHRSDSYRPDIEGLRGIAVLLVVLFHAGPFGVTGGFIGVDVFFVISGFLISGLLLRERQRAGRIDIAAFYARRMRRLVPAATIVLLVTLLLCPLAVVPLDLPRVALDGAAAALSVSNIRFAAAGGYFAVPGDPSPFLHFWSLSVEEQFYLVWPLLLVLVTRWGRPRVTAGVALLVIAGASLAACIALTAVSPDWAFYLLFTRAWQLAAGGLLAVTLAGRFGRARPLGLVGWVGLALVIAAALGFDPGTAYPGTAALVPTLGAIALVAGGDRAWGPGRLLVVGPLRWLGRISYALYLWHWPLLVLPATALGTALPLDTRLGLVAVAVGVAVVSTLAIEEPIREGVPWLRPRTRTTLARGLAAILVVAVAAVGVAVVPVALSPGPGGDRSVAIGESGPPTGPDEPPDGEVLVELSGEDALVELPGSSLALATLAASPSPRATRPLARTGLVSPTPAVAGPAASATTTVTAIPAPVPTQGSVSARTPGPAATPRATAVPPETLVASPARRPARTPRPTPVSYALPADVRPALSRARDDEERLRDDGCLAFEAERTPRECVYGDPRGSFTVALVGDSHASHWFPALERIARERGWRLVTFVKVSCPFTRMPLRNTLQKRDYPECTDFVEASIARLRRLEPDLVVTSQLRWFHPERSSDGSAVDQGEAIGEALRDVPGQKVVLVDTPWSDRDIPGCLSRNPGDVRACAIDRAMTTWGGVPDRERAAARVADGALLDLTRVLCERTSCPVAADGLIRYRDDHHLTATFSRALAPTLARAIDRVLASR